MAEEYTKTASRKKAQKRAKHKRQMAENTDNLLPRPIPVGETVKKHK